VLFKIQRAVGQFPNVDSVRFVVSGEPIPDERLEAEPTAERTAEEQARFERGN